MTTWTVPATIDANHADGRTREHDRRQDAGHAAGLEQDAIKDKTGACIYNERLPLWRSLLGEKAGCARRDQRDRPAPRRLYLLIRRTITIHIPLAVLVSAFAFAGIAYLLDSDAYVQPFYHLTSGALLFGAFFIATDPVTAPLTVRGQWIFGSLIGVFTMLVRIVGEYPEGFMYAVFLANSVRPLIDRFVRPVPVGGVPNV